MEPGFLALGVAIAKLVMRWRDVPQAADATDDAVAGATALRRLAKLQVTDPVGEVVASRLRAQLSRTSALSNADAVRDLESAAADVADLMSQFAADPDAVVAAAVYPKEFLDWVKRAGGYSLRQRIPIYAEPTFDAVLEAACAEFARLAPGSPLFEPTGLAYVIRESSHLPSIANDLHSLELSFGDALTMLEEVRRHVVPERNATERNGTSTGGKDGRQHDAASAFDALPYPVRLLDLIGPLGASSAALVSRWKIKCELSPIPIAMCSAGVVRLDLVHDGPHVLICGTTGAGKTSLLQGVMASLIAHNSPDSMRIVAIDILGSGAFRSILQPLVECSPVRPERSVSLSRNGDGATPGVATSPTSAPHVASMFRATFDPQDCDYRPLRGQIVQLRDELQRRCALLADFDGLIDRYNQMVGAARSIPRLVVVIDGIEHGTDKYPELYSDILPLARLGGDAGMHLIIATQSERELDVVLRNLGSSLDVRIAMRMGSTLASRQFIGVSDGARIPMSRKGLAFLLKMKDAARRPVLMQPGLLDGYAISSSDEVSREVSDMERFRATLAEASLLWRQRSEPER